MRFFEKTLFRNSLYVLILLELLIEVFKGSRRNGDFIGYFEAGNFVINGQHIYSSINNTWPPFFSVFSVPIAFFCNVLSRPIFQALWEIGLIVSMFFMMKKTVHLFYKKSLSIKHKIDTISITNSIFFIPFLIIFRFFHQNLITVQVNIFILLMCFVSLLYFMKNKMIPAAFLLALGTCLKVYPIFLLLYFIFKRELKFSAYTIVFILLLSLTPFIIFGLDTASEYYIYWYKNLASKPPFVHHRNQSIFASMLRFFTDLDPEMSYRANILSLDPSLVKNITYLIIGIVAIPLAYIFRKRILKKDSIQSLLEYTFIFTIIPLITPISWKANYIFIWFAYFVCYNLIFCSNINFRNSTLRNYKALFFLSIILNIFSWRDISWNYSCQEHGNVLVYYNWNHYIGLFNHKNLLQNQ